VTRRIGVLGGTFDPIHHAHLVAAQEAAWAMQLERVLFVPARQPPHKLNEPITRAHHRLAMTAAAIAANPLFDVSTVDIDREGPSYTVDTLRALSGPGTELWFIIGMDSLRDLASWYDPGGILELARVVAVGRPGNVTVDPASLEAAVPRAKGRIHLAPMPPLDISSTDIRERVATGRPIRYLTPDPVVAYIAEHGLYR